MACRHIRVTVCAWVSVVAVLLGVCAFSPIAASAKSAVNEAKVAPNEQWPECPSPTFEMCHIDITLHQASGKTPTVCSSFDNADGFCIGSSHGTPGWDSVYVPQQSIQADFTWKTSSGTVRDVDYTATETFSTVEGQIKGQVPSSNSCDLNVTDATTRLAPNVHWQTQTLKTCGVQRGPLFIDYHHPASGLGSYVHIYGYLVRKPT